MNSAAHLDGESLDPRMDGVRSGGDKHFVNVYDHLRQLARNYLSNRSGNEEIEPTAIVHEAFVKLRKSKGLDDASQSKYCAYAATAMRQILVNHYRKHSTLKRGGDFQRTDFDENKLISMRRGEDVLALEEALVKLQKVDKFRAGVVEMRFFGGMTNKEVAEATGVSESTIKNKWSATRAWLRKELTGSRNQDSAAQQGPI